MTGPLFLVECPTRYWVERTRESTCTAWSGHDIATEMYDWIESDFVEPWTSMIQIPASDELEPNSPLTSCATQSAFDLDIGGFHLAWGANIVDSFYWIDIHDVWAGIGYKIGPRRTRMQTVSSLRCALFCQILPAWKKTLTCYYSCSWYYQVLWTELPQSFVVLPLRQPHWTRSWPEVTLKGTKLLPFCLHHRDGSIWRPFSSFGSPDISRLHSFLTSDFLDGTWSTNRPSIVTSSLRSETASFFVLYISKTELLEMRIYRVFILNWDSRQAAEKWP